MGTGSSPRCWRTLIPVPITTALPHRSARIPAILAPSTSTSFGHFSRASTPAVCCRADATATPASSGTQPSRPAGTAGRSSTEKVRARRGGLIQRRPIRPRPAVCASATSTRPSPAPERAWASRSALVDPVSSTTLTSRHRPGRDASAPFSLAASSTGQRPSSLPGSESVVITQRLPFGSVTSWPWSARDRVTVIKARGARHDPRRWPPAVAAAAGRARADLPWPADLA